MAAISSAVCSPASWPEAVTPVLTTAHQCWSRIVRHDTLGRVADHHDRALRRSARRERLDSERVRRWVGVTLGSYRIARARTAAASSALAGPSGAWAVA